MLLYHSYAARAEGHLETSAFLSTQMSPTLTLSLITQQRQIILRPSQGEQLSINTGAVGRSRPVWARGLQCFLESHSTVLESVLSPAFACGGLRLGFSFPWL